MGDHGYHLSLRGNEIFLLAKEKGKGDIAAFFLFLDVCQHQF